MTCQRIQVISLNMLWSLIGWKVRVSVLEIPFRELVASVCVHRCWRCNNLRVFRRLWPMKSSVWIVSKSRRIPSTLFPQVPRPSATTNDENHAENPHIAERCHHQKLRVHHSLRRCQSFAIWYMQKLLDKCLCQKFQTHARSIILSIPRTHNNKC